MSHAENYLAETARIAQTIIPDQIEDMARKLLFLRERNAKLYLIGLGGSLANAVHMAADLRKLCNINAEAFDNLAELTARANDEGMASIFAHWLSAATREDDLFVLSVGGGTDEVSPAITRAVREFPGRVLGIVGPKGGETAARGHCVIKIPAAAPITPHTEAFQAVIWHALVSHPLLQIWPTKW